MRTVELYHGRATMAVPVDWLEIPADALEHYTLALAEVSGGRYAETYQHGFQPAGDHAFAYPHLLVQIKETGRFPLRNCLALPSIDEVERASGKWVRERMGPRVSELKLDQLFYDPSIRALRMSTTITTESVGPVAVHSVSYLTERGQLILHCFETAPRFRRSATLFARIIDSVRFSRKVAYRLRLSERWPALERLDWRHWSLAGVIVVLVVMLVVAVVRGRISSA